MNLWTHLSWLPALVFLSACDGQPGNASAQNPAQKAQPSNTASVEEEARVIYSKEVEKGSSLEKNLALRLEVGKLNGQVGELRGVCLQREDYAMFHALGRLVGILDRTRDALSEMDVAERLLRADPANLKPSPTLLAGIGLYQVLSMALQSDLEGEVHKLLSDATRPAEFLAGVKHVQGLVKSAKENICDARLKELLDIQSGTVTR